MQEHCCGLLWLAIYCFVCRSLCLILQEVQVSLLQIPLYQMEDFSRTSLAAHSFPLFPLVFFICLLVVFSLCKKTGTVGKKKKKNWFLQRFLKNRSIYISIFHCLILSVFFNQFSVIIDQTSYLFALLCHLTLNE